MLALYSATRGAGEDVEVGELQTDEAGVRSEEVSSPVCSG